MSIMKTKMLYAIVVIVIITVALIGWYYFSSQAAWSACPKLKCTDRYGNSTYQCSNVPIPNCTQVGICRPCSI